MSVNDLSNKELVVTNYMKALLQSQFPFLDLSDDGAFMEQFGTPHIKLLTPLLDIADRIKLTQSLDNASLMTNQEMDELAAGQFFYRNPGSFAIGTVTMSFDDIPANGVIQIPGGIEATSTQGYTFRSQQTISYNEQELADYYDPTTFLYKIPVPFQAENPGAVYNVNENEITNIVSSLPHFSDATNEAAFTGGVDEESNIDLANRIKQTAGTPNLGVQRGWEQFAMSFSDVRDVLVAGYGHPLMQRDIIGVTPPGRFSSNADPNVHWGGKIDLYIRGDDLVNYSDTLPIQTNTDGDLIVYLSQHPTYDIVNIQFSSPRYTDPNLDPSFFFAKDFLLMKDENPVTLGTTSETSWAVIKDDRLQAGDTATVNYRYNNLITTIDNALYQDDNRPPAADVLVLEAQKKMVHSSMVLKLESVVGIQEKDKSVIRQRIYNWMDQLPLGGEIQFSDLNTPIYSYDDTTADTKVDYISLPSQFLITDTDNDLIYYCLNQEKLDFLDQIMANSVYFNEYIPIYKDVLTVYDFFDIMHTLTYQNVENTAWKTLSFTDHDWGQKVYYIDMAKRMLAYVNTLQRLSPAKWTTAENYYFELGTLSIYEDNTYSSSDLQNLVNLFESIANPNVDPSAYDVNNILHLTVYCSVLLYVMTSDNLGGLNINDLFNWLMGLTKGTPIDYEVHT